jgi:hypothetical protein
MLVIGSLLVALTLTQAAPAAEQTGRIAGRITAEGANTPVAGVRIILMPAARPTGPMGPMSMPPQALTDQDGRYVFDRIAAGSYRINVEKSGFAPIADMTRMPTVQVAAGQTVALDFQLQKGAVIAGRIVDARNEPVTDVRIMVLRRVAPPPSARAMPGMTRLIPVGGQSQQTNDLGDYRVAGLAPGEYVVVAMPRPITTFGGPGAAASSAPPADHKPRTTIATTYYPGTVDQAAAQPIAVAAGAEVGNINFAIQSAAAFRVSGIVVDENGQPVANAMVSLTSDMRGGAIFTGPPGMTRARDDGRFDIDEVVAGAYRAHAMIPVQLANGVGGGVSGVVTGGVSGGAFSSATGAGSGSGSFVTWSSNDGSAGTTDQSVAIAVTDGDVSGVRIVTRRPARQ